MSYAHLPNAPHIDRVLAHVRAHPEKWVTTPDAELAAAWKAAWGAVRDAALDAERAAGRSAALAAARSAGRSAAWCAAWHAAWHAAPTGACASVWGAVAALVAWDDASMFLDQDPDVLRMAAAAGNHAAVLLLPAAIAMQGGTP